MDYQLKYSAIGPKARPIKNERATRMEITAKTMIPNVVVSALRVPADSGMYFFPASSPAIATGPIIGKNLERSMTNPSEMFHHGVVAARPANSLPLFADDDEYSYNISEKP